MVVHCCPLWAELGCCGILKLSFAESQLIADSVEKLLI